MWQFDITFYHYYRDYDANDSATTKPTPSYCQTAIQSQHPSGCEAASEIHPEN